jgi:hypothetical protein
MSRTPTDLNNRVLGQHLLEPVVCERLVVECWHLDPAGGAIEGERLGKVVSSSRQFNVGRQAIAPVLCVIDRTICPALLSLSTPRRKFRCVQAASGTGDSSGDCLRRSSSAASLARVKFHTNGSAIWL